MHVGPFNLLLAHMTGAPLSVMEAWQTSADMAVLTARIQLSRDLLASVRSLIPQNLRAHVQAGPVTDQDWCLLVNSSAAAAKLKQMLPDLRRHIHDVCGRELDIRIKILRPTP